LSPARGDGQIAHPKIGMEGEQRIRYVHIKRGDELRYPSDLVRIEIAAHERRAGDNQRRVSAPCEPRRGELEVGKRPLVRYAAQREMQVLGVCLDVELDASAGCERYPQS